MLAVKYLHNCLGICRVGEDKHGAVDDDDDDDGDDDDDDDERLLVYSV